MAEDYEVVFLYCAEMCDERMAEAYHSWLQFGSEANEYSVFHAPQLVPSAPRSSRAMCGCLLLVTQVPHDVTRRLVKRHGSQFQGHLSSERVH